MAGPLLFDLDGTLVDSLPDIAASTNHVRAHFGLAALDLMTVRSYVGAGLAALLRQALGPDHAAAFDEALTVYDAHHADQVTRLVQPFPGVDEHLQRWHAAGHPMGIVTNKPERFTHAIVEHLGWTELLPVIVGGDTTAAKKPDPLPVQTALERLQAASDPGQATMIGDSPADVLAGKNAGTRSIAVLYGYRDEPDLRATEPDELWQQFGGPNAP